MGWIEAGWVEPSSAVDCLGRMAQRPERESAGELERSSRIWRAPGSKSGSRTAAGWNSSRVVTAWPLAEMLSRYWAESDEAVRLTAARLTVALIWAWLRWLVGESCSEFERA